MSEPYATTGAGQSHDALYSQQQSPLFGTLPAEIRQLIYTALFTSTTLAFGKRFVSDTEYVPVKTPPNALASFRTCRRLKDEMGDSWLGLALFHFEDLPSLLMTLLERPRELRAKLRRVRIASPQTELWVPGDGLRGPHPHILLSLKNVLDYLPGLFLDTLMVLVPAQSDGRPYYKENMLMRSVFNSKGWRRICFVVQSSKTMKVFATKLGVQVALWFYSRSFLQFHNYPLLSNGYVPEKPAVNVAMYVSAEWSPLDENGDEKLRVARGDEWTRIKHQATPPWESLGSGEPADASRPLWERLLPGERADTSRQVMMVVDKGPYIDYESKLSEPRAWMGMNLVKAGEVEASFRKMFDDMYHVHHTELAGGPGTEVDGGRGNMYDYVWPTSTRKELERAERESSA